MSLCQPRHRLFDAAAALCGTSLISVVVPHGLVVATRLESLRSFGGIQTVFDHHLESTPGWQLHSRGLRAPKRCCSFVLVVPTGRSEVDARGSKWPSCSATQTPLVAPC